jgi:hypothetical protein
VRRSRSRVALALLLLAPAALAGQDPAPAGATDATVAITGVTVIDVATGRRVPGQTVVVRGARLGAVGPAARVRVPTGARVVDGRGKFLIPGLWDMHVHFMNTGVSVLPLLVAHGVTGVREIGGYLDSTRARHRLEAAGLVLGREGALAVAPILASSCSRRSDCLAAGVARRRMANVACGAAGTGRAGENDVGFRKVALARARAG